MFACVFDIKSLPHLRADFTAPCEPNVSPPSVSTPGTHERFLGENPHLKGMSSENGPPNPTLLDVF